MCKYLQVMVILCNSIFTVASDVSDQFSGIGLEFYLKQILHKIIGCNNLNMYDLTPLCM